MKKFLLLAVFLVVILGGAYFGYSVLIEEYSPDLIQSQRSTIDGL